jgi:hypothetical protein
MKISKLKHNKKRNTAFLYESLIKELTTSIISKNLAQKKLIESIIFSYFKRGTNLNKDLDSYRALYNTKNASLRNAEKLIYEARTKRERTINKKELFNEQTQLINIINKKLGKQVFNNFVPNYKYLATIAQIFNSDVTIKNKVLLENQIIKKMTFTKKDTDNMKPLDNIAYNMFAKNFNKKYSKSLSSEQRKLLEHYLMSHTDNSVSLKMFLEQEINRLKKSLLKAEAKEIDNDTKEKIKLVKEAIEQNRKKEISKEMILQILKVQELAKEILRDEI